MWWEESLCHVIYQPVLYACVIELSKVTFLRLIVTRTLRSGITNKCLVGGARMNSCGPIFLPYTHPKSFDPQCLWQRVVLPCYCVRLPGLGLRDRSPWLVLYRYKRSTQLYRRSPDRSFHGYRRSRINSTSRYIKYEVTS